MAAQGQQVGRCGRMIDEANCFPKSAMWNAVSTGTMGVKPAVPLIAIRIYQAGWPQMKAVESVSKIALAALGKRNSSSMTRLVWLITGWLILFSVNVRAAEENLPSGGSSLQSFHDCPNCPEMIVIPAGSFDMGSPDTEKGRQDIEGPVHRVNVATFALGKTEVTQGQWKAIMGNNPSRFRKCGNKCPVESVSWNDAQAFVHKLSAKTGKQYRLPSEAEWEYACRAGKQQKYCGGDNVEAVAWYRGNSGGKPHPVATKQANAMGLYDMSGNVEEWVKDSFDIHDNYKGAPTDGSSSQKSGTQRILRGGSWNDYVLSQRAANRGWIVPAGSDDSTGLRVARSLP